MGKVIVEQSIRTACRTETICYSERMTQHPITCGDCYSVKPSPEDWCAAAARVIRPAEVAHLIRWVPRLPPAWSSAANIASYFQTAFKRGDLRYIPDPKEFDLWCSPRMTFARGGGDCDDLTALAVSILHAQGIEAHMATGVFCNGSKCDGHAWVEGRDEQGWFLFEATAGEVHRYRPRGYDLQYLLHPRVCRDVRNEARRAQAQQAVALQWLRQEQIRQQAIANVRALFGL